MVRRYSCSTSTALVSVPGRINRAVVASPTAGATSYSGANGVSVTVFLYTILDESSVACVLLDEEERCITATSIRFGLTGSRFIAACSYEELSQSH